VGDRVLHATCQEDYTEKCTAEDGADSGEIFHNRVLFPDHRTGKRVARKADLIRPYNF